jgi:putative holliday junction resolvase
MSIPVVPEDKEISPMVAQLLAIPLGRILCIDYGERRVGVALSDPTQVIASPNTTLVVKQESAVVAELARMVLDNQVVAVVIGWPLHMSGSAGERTEAVDRFLQQLQGSIQVPFFSWDERWSTMSAHRALREQGVSPSKNKQRVDAIAAAIILDSFLQRLYHLRTSHQTTQS